MGEVSIADKELLDKETLHSIIEYAKWAPTGDNCQPFHFVWNGHLLKVIHDETIATHELNYCHFASRIAFGGLIRYLEIASMAHGWKAIRVKSAECWGLFEFERCEKNAALLDALKERRTQRGYFKRGDSRKLSLLAESKGDNCLFISRLSFLQSYRVAKAEAQIVNYERAFRDLLALVRFDKSENLETGMHWKNLGIFWIDSLFLRLMRKWTWTYKVFRPTLYLNVLIQMCFKIWLGNGVVTFSFNDFSEDELEKAGYRAVDFWLEAHKLGFVLQPLTLSSLVASQHKVNRVPTHFPSSVARVFKGLNSIVPSNTWMFRIGTAKPLRKDQSPLRKGAPILFATK